MALIPTMWRTCRVLANPLRLRCLRAVLRMPGRFVSDLARETRLSLPVASQYLRDLQARGLLSVERQSRWVFYGDKPDPSVGHAAPLLAAMRATLAEKDFSPSTTCRTLQGFTHPRRLAVMRLLVHSEPLPISTIRRATDISEPALLRHLRKLEDCRLVGQGEDGRWRLLPDRSPLARRLLCEACR